MSENTAIMLFKATLIPIFDYNDIFYGLLTQQQQTKMQRIQNRALRTVFRGKTLTVKQMHQTAKVAYIGERQEYHLLTLMYDRAHCDAYKAVPNRSTRQTEAVTLRVPKPKTGRLTRAPVYRGSRMWNDLPTNVRKAESMKVFKQKLKAFKSGGPAESVG